MKKLKMFICCCLLFILAGCGNNEITNNQSNGENTTYDLVIRNSLPVKIKTISIMVDNDEQVLFSQNIDYGEEAMFTLDNDLRDLNIIITPQDMFSISIELAIGDEEADIVEYEAILQKNELILAEVNHNK